MLLALARIVTTKVVLRPEGRSSSKSGDGAAWDFLFHQSGMIGSAILFGNAACKEALAHFPPQSLKDSFAVTFMAKPQPQRTEASPDDAFRHEGLDAQGQEAQGEARKLVKGIAKLKVNRLEFDKQAEFLQSRNAVYQNKKYMAVVVARWCPDPSKPEVPPVILDCVLAVPVEEGAGQVVESGPGDATAAGAEEKLDADVEAAKQARYISAFSPEDIPGAGGSSATLEVASLMNQLEERVLKDAYARTRY